ncbi:hypothetical protein DVS77_20860 [Mycolicibacterium moriokaense]|nr:hypothetical protein DVS77_20860 [Mycolicibacterium moriokaense]
MKKLVVLGASAVAASTIGLLSAGPASSDPVNPNQMNVIGEPYYKAVKILHGMGVSTSFGGSVGSALPQAQCMVTSQKAGGSKMILNLDCTEEAAQEMADNGSMPSQGTAPGGVRDNTIRPPQIPISQGAPAPAPAG